MICTRKLVRCMNKNFKKILSFLIVFIIGISTTVGAVTIFNSKDITYSSDKTAKTNVKEALDELYENLGKCPKGQYCYTDAVGLSDKVELGDYISMTPKKTSYTISKSVTGYSQDQTINPSELNLWLVLRKNDNGSIDVVSWYTTNNEIVFKGETGFLNLAGVLNRASNDAFIDNELVEVGWSYGYNGQPEYCSKLEGCMDDRLYLRDKKDLWLLTHETRGIKPGTREKLPYFFPTRIKDVGRKAYLAVYHLTDSMDVGYATLYTDDGQEGQVGSGLRPMLRLKNSARIVSGDGSIGNPYLIN